MWYTSFYPAIGALQLSSQVCTLDPAKLCFHPTYTTKLRIPACIASCSLCSNPLSIASNDMASGKMFVLHNAMSCAVLQGRFLT